MISFWGKNHKIIVAVSTKTKNSGSQWLLIGIIMTSYNDNMDIIWIQLLVNNDY